MQLEVFTPASQAPASYDFAYWFLFDGYKLFVLPPEEASQIPLLHAPADVGLDVMRQQFVGWLGDTACFSAEVHPIQTPATGSFHSLRALYGKLDEQLFWIAGRAIQLVDWDRTHQFCGKCGQQPTTNDKEHVKVCPSCKHRTYPRLSPAVIVAVTKGDRILLGHNRHHPPQLYTVLAGFVEAGETFEETVAREIREEVGIEVKNIRYFGSQPWPFPNSIMIGFTAEWASGEFVFEDDDIETAEWFSAENMPVYPNPPSIANALIETWRQRVLANK